MAVRQIPVAALLTYYTDRNTSETPNKHAARQILRYIKRWDSARPATTHGDVRIASADDAFTYVAGRVQNKRSAILGALGVPSDHSVVCIPVPCGDAHQARPTPKHWPSRTFADLLETAGVIDGWGDMILYRKRMPSKARERATRTAQNQFDALVVNTSPDERGIQNLTRRERISVVLVDDTVTWGETLAGTAEFIRSSFKIEPAGAIVIGTTDKEPQADALAGRRRTITYDPTARPSAKVWRVAIV